MNNGIKIITTYDNQRVQLIFNESFLCPERKGIIDVDLGSDIYNWKLRLVFDDIVGAQPYSTEWQFGVEDVNVLAKFHKWSNTSWIELSKPKLISSKDGSVKVYIKIRSEYQEDHPFYHNIHLSIWKVI